MILFCLQVAAAPFRVGMDAAIDSWVHTFSLFSSFHSFVDLPLIIKTICWTAFFFLCWIEMEVNVGSDVLYAYLKLIQNHNGLIGYVSAKLLISLCCDLKKSM